MKFFGQKQGPWAKALCLLTVTFFPVFARGFDRANGAYRLRDDVNTGGTRQSNGDYILNGSVGTVVTNPLGNEDYTVVAGSQNGFYYPTTITDLSLVPHSHDTLHMGWTAPAAGVAFDETVASYEIRYSLSPINDDNFKAGVLRGGEGITPLSPRTLHANVPLSGLTYDTPYYVGIVSYDNNNPSNMSYVGSTGPIWTLAKLPSVISLSSDASNRSVTLTFSPENPDNHEISFEGVISTSSEDPTPGTENTGTKSLPPDGDSGPKTMVFDTIIKFGEDRRLRRGPLYYVHLRAYNGNNDPTAWQVFGPVDIDRRLPTGLTVSSLSASSLNVSWVNHLPDGKYQALVDTVDSFTSPIVLPTVKANINSQEFTGLKGNTGYFYKVRAWDNDEVDPISDTTFGSTVTHVLKPEDVSVVADSLSTNGATLKWQDDEDNSTESHSFHVELATKPFDTNPSLIDGPEVFFDESRSMEAVVGSLKPNTPYYVRITGKNSAGVQSQGSDVFVSLAPVFYTLPAQPEVTIVDSSNPTYEISFSLDGKENNPLQTAYVAKVYASPDCTTESVNAIHIDPGMSLSEPFIFSSQVEKPIFANAQYSVCVTAEWASGAHEEDVVSVARSTFTKPLPAQAMAVVQESSHTVNVTWEDHAGVAQNSSTTNYQLEWRLDGDPTLIDAQSVIGLESMVGGLSANTTYQFKLTAQAAGSDWGNSEARFTFGVTLATVPVPGALTLDTNSAIVEWDPNGNPVSTAYQVKLRNESEVDFPSGSIEKGIPRATVSGLTPNTTYWAWARAINHEEKPTDWTVWGPKATDPNIPNDVVADLGVDGAKNVYVRWGGNGNPAGTTYIVKVIRSGTSDTFDAPFKLSSPILQGETADSLVWTFSDLIPNTAYQVRVDAVGHNGRVASSDVKEISTQASGLADPRLSAGEIDPLHQINVAWTDNENPTGTMFVVEIATSNAFSRGTGTETKSVTLTKADGTTNYFLLFTDLDPNRRYFGHVGTKAGTSAPVFGTVISTYTYPATPTGLVPVATAMGATHRITFSWLSGENEPTGTRYQLELARDNEFVDPVGTYPVGFGQTVLEVPVDLEANREYFAHVRAVGNVGDGIMSGWSLSASTFTAVAAPSGVTVDSDTNTLKVVWVGGDGTATNASNTKYKLTWETGGISSSLTSAPGALTLTASALTPNTTYTLTVAALPGTGSFWPDGVTLVGDRVTLAKPPLAGSYTLFTSSASVSWGNNENPLGKTLYRVEVDADAGFSSVDQFSETRALSTNVTGLAPNTTYYGRMKAINHANTVTSWVPVWLASATYAAVPSLALDDFTLYSDSGTVTWNPNGNPAGTRYKVWLATEATFGIAPRSIDVFQATAGDVKVSQEFRGLVSNQLYFVRVDVLGHNGTTFSSPALNKNTSAGLVPAVALSPSGDKTRELTLQWDNTKNSPETRYVVELSTDSSFNETVTARVTTLANANQHLFGPALISNKLYFAHVKADAGESNFSTVASTYTHPEKPVGVAARTAGLTEPTHQVAIEWNHGNNDVNTVYKVTLNSGETLLSSLLTVAGDTFFIFTEENGVELANHQYVGSVQAQSVEGGNDSESVPVTVFTAPLAPLRIDVTEVTTGTITTGWSKPSVIRSGRTIRNAVPSTNYQVEWVPAEGVNFERFDNSDTGLYTYQIGSVRPLIPNTTYYLNVKSITADGSPWPSPVASSTVVTLPNPPILTLSGITVNHTSMTVVWDPNSNSDGTRYELRIFNTSENHPYFTFGTRLTTPGDLTPGSPYKVKVNSKGHSGADRWTAAFDVETLPDPPENLEVRTLDPLDEKQRLYLTWSSGRNDSNNTKYSWKVNQGAIEGVWSDRQSELFATVENLSPNVPYELEVRSSNSFPKYSVIVTTSAWTRAAIPLAPIVVTPLVDGALGIGFGAPNNPESTKYAIQLKFESGGGNYAHSPSVDGSSFDQAGPVWLTRSEWVNLGNGVIYLSGLSDDPRYQVVFYSRNERGEISGPGAGLPIEQSAGTPSLELQTWNGIVTNLVSKEQAVYFNSTTIPFRAFNSSHFNVILAEEEKDIVEENVNQSLGWNGKIDPSKECVTSVTVGVLLDKAVKGFCVEKEGLYFLNVAGTAVVGENLNGSIVSTTPFRVFIDTTPPVPPALQLSFLPTPFEPLLQDTLYGNPNPTFVWGTDDTLGNSVSRSPILGWTYSVSTDPEVLPVQSTDPANGFIPFESHPSISVDLHDVTHSSGTVFYRVRGCDLAGNWTPDTRVPAFRYLYTPDQVLPELAGVEMDGKLFPALDKTIRYAAVTPKEEFLHVKFSEPMLISTHAIQLTLLRGADGRSVNQAVALNTIDASVGIQGDGKQILPFASITQLEPGCLYRFLTSSSPMPTDRANNPLTAKLDILFYTAMDPATPAVFASEQGDVSVNVSAFALGTDPVGVAINDRPDKISVAGSPSLPRLLDEANDALSRQRGGAFKKIFVAKELTAFKTNGEMRAQNFPGTVQMGFDYAAYVGDNGRMDGTTIKTKDLVICELDERTGVWNKIPNSRVDEASQKVFAPLRHNGTYALAGEPNYDLADAHPYPVPYRSARDEHGITFTGLSSFGTIKVFTLDGRLVKTLAFNGESSMAWEPVTSDSGESVGSDVYLYMIENDHQRIVGKLMVIR